MFNANDRNTDICSVNRIDVTNNDSNDKNNNKCIFIVELCLL